MGILSRRRAAPLLAVVLALASACGRDVSGPYANVYGLRFMEVWKRFDRYYPFFDVKGVDWAARRGQYEERAWNLRSQQELVALIQELEAPLRDGNLWLVRPDGTTLPGEALADRPSNWDAAVSAQYTARAGWHPGGPDWGWGRFGDVGYLRLESFVVGRVGARQVDAALDSLADSRALVIDVRTNAGGNSILSDSIAGRFTNARRLFGYIQGLQGDDAHTVTARQGVYIDPRGPFVARPVLLLIGRRSFNATEQFVLQMKAFPGVTLLGDATGGSLGYPSTFDLGDGWSYSMSRLRLTTPDGRVVEDAGIPPHVAVPATAADFARGLDPVLDAALARAAALPPP